VAFLCIDLDLSSTILKTAEMATSLEHAYAALERVRQAIKVIRRLGGQLRDPDSRTKVHDRTNELESRMNSLIVRG
jgi:hypothetical protein